MRIDQNASRGVEMSIQHTYESDVYLMALDALGEPLRVPCASGWWGSVVAELHRHCVSGRSTAFLVLGRRVDMDRTLRAEIEYFDEVAIGR